MKASSETDRAWIELVEKVRTAPTLKNKSAYMLFMATGHAPEMAVDSIVDAAGAIAALPGAVDIEAAAYYLVGAISAEVR